MGIFFIDDLMHFRDSISYHNRLVLAMGQHLAQHSK